jgi:hypothetical protein
VEHDLRDTQADRPSMRNEVALDNEAARLLRDGVRRGKTEREHDQDADEPEVESHPLPLWGIGFNQSIDKR